MNQNGSKVEDTYGEFWEYLSQNQKDLFLEGNFLMNDIIRHTDYTFKDYSFLIFPYAKAYEGYLKKLFLDLKFISHLDYISDHLRLGKLMAPQLVAHLGERSLYTKIKQKTTKETADLIWETWRVGRNQVFHYFPHNTRYVSFEEAEETVNRIIMTMKEAHEKLYGNSSKSEVESPKSEDII